MTIVIDCVLFCLDV